MNIEKHVFINQSASQYQSVDLKLVNVYLHRGVSKQYLLMIAFLKMYMKLVVKRLIQRDE